MGLSLQMPSRSSTRPAPVATGDMCSNTSYPTAIADYIRSHTAVDARVFSPYGDSMTFATGRPNAMGFPGLVHQFRVESPEYRDVRNHLEPAAIRRLGFEYVHAPEAWVESLPDEAAARLADPRLFELLVRDESESLYRVLPAFLMLHTPPAPASYEALRQAVPASATVFLLRYTDYGYRKQSMVRAASALSHTRLRGVIDQTALQLRTPWRAQPLGDHVPDLVIAPANFAPWMLPPALQQPIWWNDDAAVYALHGTVDPIMPPPPRAQPFSVQRYVVRRTPGRLGRHRFHRDLLRPCAPYSVERPGLGAFCYQGSTVAPPRGDYRTELHPPHGQMVCGPYSPGFGNDLACVRIRLAGQRPGGSKQRRRIEARPVVPSGIGHGQLRAGRAAEIRRSAGYLARRRLRSSAQYHSLRNRRGLLSGPRRGERSRACSIDPGGVVFSTPPAPERCLRPETAGHSSDEGISSSWPTDRMSGSAMLLAATMSSTVTPNRSAIADSTSPACTV